MKEQYSNENRGALFQNHDKKTDKHPDYKGEANVNGKDYWLSAWKRESKSGKTYLSLSFQEKEEQQDDLWPEKTGKESDSWQQAREKFKKDDVTDTEEEIDLSSIPF